MKLLFKPTLYIAGVFGFLYFATGLMLVNFPTQAGSWHEADLAVTFMPYRVAAYLGIVSSWRWLSVWLTKPSGNPLEFSAELNQRWQERSELTARAWWKVALFFTLFELVAIQKVGF